ncbi:MAG: radical SAM protein [Mariprofundaceae bacterium]|nr:radical SAM protein [Mariprofundaceae bacterium]
MACSLIRLSGCDLRCHYCDTKESWSFKSGKSMSFEHIMQAAPQDLILVTGGEPLAQPQTPQFLKYLCQQAKQVQLETSGAYDISQLDPRVHCVLDLKTPSSGETNRMLWHNLQHLQANDEVKFVLSDRNDYDWSCSMIKQHGLEEKEATILLSPAWQCLDPATLGEWMLVDQVKARLHIQQHKYIWGDIKGI